MLAQLSGLALALAPLPGCQSIVGSPNLSQVRIIDASPDAPGLDIYEGSAVVAYNLGLGTITSYVPVAPGSHTINIDSAGTRTTLISATGGFLANAQYTVLVANFTASLQELVLTDQSQPAPSGDIALRFLDESARAGAVDVYLVPSGATLLTTAPALTGIGFNTNTGYMNIPTGTYTIEVLPTGTVPTAKTTSLYTGAAVTYAGGAAKTIVFIDTVGTTTASVQVVTANDYDPD